MLKKFISIVAMIFIMCTGLQTVRAEELTDCTSWVSGSNIRYRNINIDFGPNGQFDDLDIKVKASSDILGNKNYDEAYISALHNWNMLYTEGVPTAARDVSLDAPNTANVSIEFETDPIALADNPNAITYLFDEKGTCVNSNEKYTINGKNTKIKSIREYYNCPTDNLLIKVKSVKIFINKNVFDQYSQSQKISVITHELGHAYGMGHNESDLSIMNPSLLTNKDYFVGTVQFKDKQDLLNMYKDFKPTTYSWNSNGWLNN